jgi:hypothetical protein
VGAETTLKSATDLVLDVDDDNNGTNILSIRNGANTEVAQISEVGDQQMDGVLTSDGTSTSDFDGPVTAPSFTSDAVATPTITLDDSDSASETSDATIVAQATDVGAGTEDVDLTFNVQVNSTLTTRMTIDADGNVQVNNGALQLDAATDPADSEPLRFENNEGIAWEASPAGTDVVMKADASEIIQITGGTLDAADLSGTVPDASVNGAGEADEIDIDNLAGLTNVGSSITKTTTNLIFSGVEADFEAGASNAWPRLLNETTPTTTDCDAAGEAGRLLFDPDADTDGTVLICRGASGWKDIDDDGVGGGGSMNSFNVDGDNVAPQVISDGNTLLIAGGTNGIDTVASATDTVTLNLDLTEIAAQGLAASKVGTFIDSVYIPAGSMDVDGTQCTKVTSTVINSGPMILAINCTDNAAGIVYFEVNMPDSWANSGIVTVEAQTYTVDATVTGPGTDANIGWDVSCQARGDGETINSTWGTAQNLDITFATQYVEEHATTNDITPNDFEAGDTLYCRAVIDISATDTATADMRLKGFKMEFTRALGD